MTAELALEINNFLKQPQWSQRFQWSQWFSGRAEIDALVYELCGLMGEEIEVEATDGSR